METPAAVILETVQGEGGLNVARIDWLKRLEALVQQARHRADRRRHPGRLRPHRHVLQLRAGRHQARHHHAVEVAVRLRPADGAGRAQALARREWKPGEHNGTFRGNNHAFVTATAAIEQYWSTAEFATAIRAKGEYIAKRLQAMVDTFSGDLIDVRGRGMMIGVRCADAKRAAAGYRQVLPDGPHHRARGPGGRGHQVHDAAHHHPGPARGRPRHPGARGVRGGRRGGRRGGGAGALGAAGGPGGFSFLPGGRGGGQAAIPPPAEQKPNPTRQQTFSPARRRRV